MAWTGPVLGATAAPGSPPSWTVYHGALDGNGAATSVASVDLSTPAWTSPALDGELYGEPLVSGGRIYVATENDTVIALSASTGAVVWSTHVGTPVPAASLPCGDISPTVGITGTPVIDEARDELFVVADELVNGTPAHRWSDSALDTGTVELCTRTSTRRARLRPRSSNARGSRSPPAASSSGSAETSATARPTTDG